MSERANKSASGIGAVLAGAYGCGNLGDDALMLAGLSILRKIYRPEEIALWCADAPYLARLAPGIRVIPHDVRQIGRAELLVYGGGTQWFSFPGTKASAGGLLRKAAGALIDPKRAARFLARKAAPLKSHFARAAALGVGVGPFVAGSAEERGARELFASLDFVGVRDRASAELLASWGIKDVKLGSDLCFAGELWGFDAEVVRARTTKRTAESRKRVGIIPRDWPHTKEGAAYEGPLMEAVRTMREDGVECQFVLMGPETDRGWAERLRAAREEVWAWDPEKMQPAEFAAGFAEFDCIVTARYHGAVFAAMAGVPFIAVEVEPKLKGAAEQFGGEGARWEAPFDAQMLAGKIEKAFERARDCATAPDIERIAARRMIQEFKVSSGTQPLC